MRKAREIYRLMDAARGTVILSRVERAAGFWERLVGLIGRKSLPSGEGLWIDPCNGIHTFGMRFPLDVLVLDETGRVLRILTKLGPWRVSLPVRGARSAVEMAAGTLTRTDLSVSDLVAWERE